MSSLAMLVLGNLHGRDNATSAELFEVEAVAGNLANPTSVRRVLNSLCDAGLARVAGTRTPPVPRRGRREVTYAITDAGIAALSAAAPAQ